MKLRSRERLLHTAFIEEVARRVLSSLSQQVVVESVYAVPSLSSSEIGSTAAWLTVGSGELWRVALLSPVFLPAAAALARSRAALSVAGTIAEIIGDEMSENVCRDADTIVTSSSAPPVGWSGVEVHTPFGTLLCVGVFDPSLRGLVELPQVTSRVQSVTSSANVRGLRLPLVGYGKLPGAALRVGGTINLADLVLCIPDAEATVRVFMEDGLMMELEAVKQRESVAGAVPVRVDLGSLELTLEEIAALRAGHLLDLDSQLPAACFLRIGSTVIAEGVLDSAPAGLVIQLKKIVDIDATPEALFAM
jgi:hypothetical protein